MEAVKKKTYEDWYPLPQKILRSDYKVWTYKEIFHFITGLHPDDCYKHYCNLGHRNRPDKLDAFGVDRIEQLVLCKWSERIPEKNLIEIKKAIDFGFSIDSMVVFWMDKTKIKSLHKMMNQKIPENKPDPVIAAIFLGEYYFITNY